MERANQKEGSKKEEDSQDDKDFKAYLYEYGFVIVGVVIVFGVIASQIWVSSEERSGFGDLFGFLNTVFTGLAFAGVIATLILQKKDLDLTRRELKRQADSLDQSQKALNKQIEEMNFSAKVNALKSYIDTVDGIKSNEYNSNKDVARKILISITEERMNDHSFFFEPKIEFEDQEIYTGGVFTIGFVSVNSDLVLITQNLEGPNAQNAVVKIKRYPQLLVLGLGMEIKYEEIDNNTIRQNVHHKMEISGLERGVYTISLYTRSSFGSRVKKITANIDTT